MENIPYDTFKSLINLLDDTNINNLKGVTTHINNTIVHYQKENVYYKHRVSKLLEFDIGEDIISNRWEDLYNKLNNKLSLKKQMRTVSQFGSIDLAHAFYNHIKTRGLTNDYTEYQRGEKTPIMKIYKPVIASDDLELFQQMERDLDDIISKEKNEYGLRAYKKLKENFARTATTANAVNILTYLIDDLEIDTKLITDLIVIAIRNSATEIFKYLRKFLGNNNRDIIDIFVQAVESDALEIFLDERDRNPKVWDEYFKDNKSNNNFKHSLGARIGKLLLPDFLKDKTFIELVYEFIGHDFIIALIDDPRMTTGLFNGVVYPSFHDNYEEDIQIEGKELGMLIYSNPLLDFDIITIEELKHLHFEVIKMLINKQPQIFNYNTYRQLFLSESDRHAKFYIKQMPKLVHDRSLYYKLMRANDRKLIMLLQQNNDKEFLNEILQIARVLRRNKIAKIIKAKL